MNAATVTRLDRQLSLSLLVADHDALTRCLVADELRSHGFRVVEASSAQDACTILRSLPIHVLLTDIDVSGPGEGLGIARFAKTLRPEPKIILASGESRSADIPGIAELGVFLAKPYVISRILQVLKQSSDPAGGSGP